MSAQPAPVRREREPPTPGQDVYYPLEKPRPQSRYDLKFMQYRPQDDGGWLLHGHIHEKWRQNGRQINVGVVAWHFAPVSDDTICEMIKAGPARIGSGQRQRPPAISMRLMARQSPVDRRCSSLR